MTVRRIAQRNGQPGSWIPGDVLPSVQTPPYMAPMFEFKQNHYDPDDSNLSEGSGLGCQCEEYGDDEWTDMDEAMHWSPAGKSRLERQRAALARLLELARGRDIPEED